MAIYIGTDKSKEMYFGTRKVKEIYLGTGLIYRSDFHIYTPGDTNTLTSYKPDTSYNGEVSYRSDHMYLSVNALHTAAFYTRKSVDFSSFDTLKIRLASQVGLPDKSGWFGIGSTYSSAQNNKVDFTLSGGTKTITKNISEISSTTKLWCSFSGGSSHSAVNVFEIWLE